MILLFNVKITSQGLSYYERADHMPKYSRMDIFKYCLASYSALLPVLTKVILYIQVEQEFIDRKDELEAYIHELFPADKLELHWHRKNYTHQWKEISQQFADDDLIWFAGNDDHIFIDYNLDVVRAGIKLLNEDPDPYSVIYYSHWPEQMRMSMHYNGTLTADGNFIKFNWRTFDAIRILKGARFKRYWQDVDLGNDIIFRTDTLYHIGYELPGPVYAPTRELVRHYDGYSHVNREQMANVAPPLFIPPNFFTKDMRISIGYENRDNNWTNLNPSAAWLYAANPAGTDYRWVQEDIPLFWQGHIKEIHTAPRDLYDPAQIIQDRNTAFLSMSRVPMMCYNITFTEDGAAPVEWFNNHLR
jgi:hypothetical protein